MRPDEREVAGLTCSQVLASLSAYADGEVPAALAARIEAHVAECRACERFGRDFSRLLTAMRRHLAAPDPVPDEVAARLRAALPE
ncbi:MAG: anti-sigma factor [Vicinamibacterales bacterium]